MENKTARLTVLIDPAKKLAFEKLCYSQDMTPSQVMRRLIREYMEGAQAAAPAPRPVRVGSAAKLVQAARARQAKAPAPEPKRRASSR